MGALLAQLLAIADQQVQLWARVLRARALPGRPRHTEFHAGWTDLLERVGVTVPGQEPVAYFFDR